MFVRCTSEYRELLKNSDLCHLFPLEFPAVLPIKLHTEGAHHKMLIVEQQLMKMCRLSQNGDLFLFLPPQVYHVALVLWATTSSELIDAH